MGKVAVEREGRARVCEWERLLWGERGRALVCDGERLLWGERGSNPHDVTIDGF